MPRKKSTSRSAPTWVKWLIPVAVLALLAALVIGRLGGSSIDAPAFDGEAAMERIREQVALGPRAPGSPGHAAAREYLTETLRTHTDQVSEQTFEYVDRRDSTRVIEGVNIIASLNPNEGRRVMLAAHWDTRPTADRDPDSTRRFQPVPGANDGASGVAVLLELARAMSSDPPDVGVDFVLFDLEDMGEEGDTAQVGNPFAIGAEMFADAFDEYRPSLGVVVDMVCDRDLRIPQELNSLTHAGPVMEKIWASADRLGADAFVDERGQAVMDDHVPFLRRGVRVVDLIHTPFPSYWHTLEDTPDKCSAESLQQVGDVLIDVVYRE